jgi:hypothetical protein
MTDRPTIELPRIDDESARAYAARVAYAKMGPQRSLEKLRQQIGNRSVRYLEQWSTKYGWTKSAEDYDRQLTYITLEEAQEAYRADLADYRKRYGDMGKALYGSAVLAMRKINAVLGKPETELGVGSLITIINAVKTAADLEALALRVEHLLQDTDGTRE